MVVVAGQERASSERLGTLANCLVPSALFVCSRVGHVFLYKVPCHLTTVELPSAHNHHHSLLPY